MGVHEFSAADYSVFVLTLGLSCAVGVYFGCFKGRQKTATEYLFGNRNMKAIPVGLSLYSSAVSAVTIIGVPTEIYVFGTQFMMVFIGVTISMFTTCFFIIPVFCGSLKINTPYEYLELRFNTTVRKVSSLVYVLQTLLILPVILFSCCLAFSVASGIALPVCTTVIGGICVLYTMMGGFTTVIWTDTLQATLMIGSCICVMAIGIANAGGIQEVWAVADQGKRLNFINWDPNPLVRMSMWTVSIGMAVQYMSHMGCAASSLQRYISVASEKQARISLVIGCMGYVTMLSICGLTGLAMYATYKGCDPVKNKVLSGTNMLTPYFAFETIGNIPGMSGLFAAGVLSAGLSTLSAEMNTLSGLIYHDFLHAYIKRVRSETAGAYSMKIIVLLMGIYLLILAPVMQRIQYIMQLLITLTGVTYGSKLGVLLLGSTFPQSNSQGTLWGFIVGIICSGYVSIGGLFHDMASQYALPVSTDSCPRSSQNQNYSNFTAKISDFYNMTIGSLDNFNFTTELDEINETSTLSTDIKLVSEDSIFFVYRIAYMYYPTIGVLTTVAVGLIVSYITGPNDVSKMDQRLFIPCMRTKQPIKNDVIYRDGKLTVI